MAIKLKIITPLGIFFDDVVEIITVKTTEGYIGILEQHIPIVANLEIAQMFVKQHKKTYKLLISSGILYSTKKEVKILTDYIEYDDKAKDHLLQLAKDRHTNMTNF
ncbi:F0F1 ATP synthase subunit epsilon [Spiroplasma endosymbiont of Agriotes lineatus]|uniref:F0F1 ATP synthase subunit epsilon n=1 Tax=Spiroplasma endosymbiont of Agriotes lineatus TaxID=3077930 RepID=UPI0030D50FF4